MLAHVLLGRFRWKGAMYKDPSSYVMRNHSKDQKTGGECVYPFGVDEYTAVMGGWRPAGNNVQPSAGFARRVGYFPSPIDILVLCSICCYWEY